MGKTNKNLSESKKLAFDEFYTLYSDIEKEVIRYEDSFKNKSILCNCGAKEQYDLTLYCNCDHPSYSNFFEYFCRHAIDYSIKSVWATWYDPDINPETGSTYAVLFRYPKNANPKDYDPDNWKDYLKKFEIPGNGDFRSEPCIKIMQSCDIVVTNPPFSLFREYIDLLYENNKTFLILGNLNAITYKNIFKLIKENKLWFGQTRQGTGKMWFKIPKDAPIKSGQKEENGNRYQSIGTSLWFTNIMHNKRLERMELKKIYAGHEEEYPQYDNYSAYECSKAINIPYDSGDKIFGVPITWLTTKYCPTLFEIIGNEYSESIERGRVYINNKRMYSRIFIRRRPEDIERYGNR